MFCCVNLSRAWYCQELLVGIYCYYNAMFPISYLPSSPSFSSSSQGIVKVVHLYMINAYKIYFLQTLWHSISQNIITETKRWWSKRFCELPMNNPIELTLARRCVTGLQHHKFIKLNIPTWLEFSVGHTTPLTTLRQFPDLAQLASALH